MRSPQTAKQAVEMMIALLSTNAWCQGFFATDANGKATGWHDRRAEKFCLRGAMFHVCDIARNGSAIMDQVERTFIEVLDEKGWCSGMASWNDVQNRTAGQVLDLLNEVKERC
jgi:hypothetical protein